MIAFGIAAFVVVVSVMSGRVTTDAVTQIKITFIATSLGTLVALFSAILLLTRAVSGARLAELLPLSLPLMAGVLVASFDWAVAVVFGALGVSMFIREMVGTPAERRGGD